MTDVDTSATGVGHQGAPTFRAPDVALFQEALRLGIQDLKRAPLLGLFFGAFYVLCGWAIACITWITGHSYWLVLAAIGFPLIGPFAATGLYETSRRISNGLPLNAGEIFGVVWQQRGRQLPWLCAIIVILFLFWFFLGHMIFALFLGLATMTNISSSLAVYVTPEGLQMLGFGTLIGGGFALVLYSFSVLSMPMLLDREVDFVTAMLTSIAVVRRYPVPMLGWAFAVALMTFLALVPWFLGLLVALPVLGHASWHVYALMKIDA